VARYSFRASSFRAKNVSERLGHRYADRGQLTVLSAVLVFDLTGDFCTLQLRAWRAGALPILNGLVERMLSANTKHEVTRWPSFSRTNNGW
jgi:hypothetical protein